MRPISAEFPTSQNFRDGATAGVVANPDPDSGMGYYVWLYGDYQPYGHAGWDGACPIGTPIYAPADGTVLYAGWTEDLPGTGDIRKWLMYYNFGGILTAIQHDGWISFIAHQSDNNMVQPGMRVKEGQLIGKSGNTKTRTTTVAPHVHVEALVFMDYRTDVSKGIIYGRVDPTQFFGTAAIAPQSTTPQEFFTMAQFDDLRAWASTTHAKLNNIAAAVNDIAAKNRLFHGQTHAKVNAVKSVVDQLAKGQNVVIDWAKVEEAAKAGAAEALAEGIVTVDVSVNGKDAA